MRVIGRFVPEAVLAIIDREGLAVLPIQATVNCID